MKAQRIKPKVPATMSRPAKREIKTTPKLGIPIYVNYKRLEAVFSLKRRYNPEDLPVNNNEYACD